MPSRTIGDCQKHITPMSMELYGENLNLKAFQGSLETALRLVINTFGYGYGPDRTVGLVMAHFNKLRENNR